MSTTTKPTLTREEFKALAKEMLKNDKTILAEITKEMEEEKEFEKLLSITNEKYKEVWKALA